MSWIKTIKYENADKKLKSIYNKVKGADNNIDNVLLVHSLRPHSLVGHMALYKNVLHNSNNTLPKWYLEAIGVYVSFLNKCDYCVTHHFEGFKRLLNDDEKAKKYLNTVLSNSLDSFFEEKYLLGINYAKDLTNSLHSINKKTIDDLINIGFSEGEILEINQVTSYFNYVNRTVVGLGVTTEGDIIGLSPNNSDNPDDWNHK
ncbi:MAG: peroxidase-related enzyme [Flavobacteriaceae bacterium]